MIPRGTGVVLNNEMDDFSVKPGVPNLYGLIGAEANAIAPGKRPLSSMSPTFIENEHAVAILGTPGGSRIISMVLLGILDFADGKMPESWVSLPRFHHQYYPDVVQYEEGAFDAKTLQRCGKGAYPQGPESPGATCRRSISTSASIAYWLPVIRAVSARPTSRSSPGNSDEPVSRTGAQSVA